LGLPASFYILLQPAFADDIILSILTHSNSHAQGWGDVKPKFHAALDTGGAYFFKPWHCLFALTTSSSVL
jgi:hypothetical protein